MIALQQHWWMIELSRDMNQLWWMLLWLVVTDSCLQPSCGDDSSPARSLTTACATADGINISSCLARLPVRHMARRVMQSPWHRALYVQFCQHTSASHDECVLTCGRVRAQTQGGRPTGTRSGRGAPLGWAMATPCQPDAVDALFAPMESIAHRFPGKSGRILQEIVWRAYVTKDNATIPYYDSHGKPTMERHAQNAREQDSSVKDIMKSIVADGQMRGVRGELSEVRIWFPCICLLVVAFGFWLRLRTVAFQPMVTHVHTGSR